MKRSAGGSHSVPLLCSRSEWQCSLTFVMNIPEEMLERSEPLHVQNFLRCDLLDIKQTTAASLISFTSLFSLLIAANFIITSSIRLCKRRHVPEFLNVLKVKKVPWCLRHLWHNDRIHPWCNEEGCGFENDNTCCTIDDKNGIFLVWYFQVDDTD